MEDIYRGRKKASYVLMSRTQAEPLIRPVRNVFQPPTKAFCPLSRKVRVRATYLMNLPACLSALTNYHSLNHFQGSRRDRLIGALFIIVIVAVAIVIGMGIAFLGDSASSSTSSEPPVGIVSPTQTPKTLDSQRTDQAFSN